jgi:uncharacterized membrane protein
MSLEDVPSYFAIITGLNETTAQLILSLVIICIVLFPYLILAHNNPSPMISLLLLFLGEAITLGLGWSPFWIMIMFMVLTSAGIAVLGARTVTGG